jgi:hypothetical protein
MLGSVLSGLLALIKAVPTLKEWFDQLMALYAAQAVVNLKKADRDAMRKLFDEQDQRDLEKQLGSIKAGEPSNLGGTEFRDSIPGVLQHTDTTGDKPNTVGE